MSQRLALCLLFAGVLALADGPAAAADAQLLKKCTICHGDRGLSDESAYPTIAGLPARLQIDALKAYRSGTRDCGPVVRMCKIVADMTDDQVWHLNRGGHDQEKVYAAFSAAVKHKGQPTVILAKTVKGYGMSPADAEKSILHGQWADYLRYSLTQYRLGHRKQPPSMRRQTEKLSDADIEALVNFYASYR